MKKEITIKDLRQFGVVLTIITGVLGSIHFFKGHTSAYPWFLGIAFISMVSSVFVPQALNPIFIVFTKVTSAIGWFNTRVILIFVYYLILVPIGLLMRIFGKDLLGKKICSEENGYWEKRQNPAVDKEALEKQF